MQLRGEHVVGMAATSWSHADAPSPFPSLRGTLEKPSLLSPLSWPFLRTPRRDFCSHRNPSRAPHAPMRPTAETEHSTMSFVLAIDDFIDCPFQFEPGPNRGDARVATSPPVTRN